MTITASRRLASAAIESANWPLTATYASQASRKRASKRGRRTRSKSQRSTGTGFTAVSTSAAASSGDTALLGRVDVLLPRLSAQRRLIATAYASSITVDPAGAAARARPRASRGRRSRPADPLSWTDTDRDGLRIMAGAANVSGDLAANTTIWLQTGLGVNTSSGALSAQAFNSTGTANSGSLTRFRRGGPDGTLAAPGASRPRARP